jgi:hypothetical protein
MYRIVLHAQLDEFPYFDIILRMSILLRGVLALVGSISPPYCDIWFDASQSGLHILHTPHPQGV